MIKETYTPDVCKKGGFNELPKRRRMGTSLSYKQVYLEMSKYTLFVTAILVCISCIGSVIGICSASKRLILGGSDSPTSIVLQASDSAPIILHYIMLQGGLVFLASYIAISFWNKSSC